METCIAENQRRFRKTSDIAVEPPSFLNFGVSFMRSTYVHFTQAAAALLTLFALANAGKVAAQTTSVPLQASGPSSGSDSPQQQAGEGGQSGGDAANASNNPLTPKPTVFIQDYGIPTTFGAPDQAANQLFIRGVLPFKVFGQQQLARLSAPLLTVPTPSGTRTGLGDVQFLDVNIKLIKGFGSVGVGPLLVFPTADSRSLGQGKWQAGAAALLISPQKWGLVGGLVTFSQSFAAAEQGRPTVSLLAVEPIVTKNLPGGFYLRSSATSTFDFASHLYLVPIGFGAGKVWQVAKGSINAYFEPQYSIVHEGPNQAKWQLLAGLTLQFK